MQNEPIKNLMAFATEMVTKYATYDADNCTFDITFDQLSEDEQGEFAALYLEYDGRDTSECFSHPDQNPLDDDITIALLQVLKNNSYETRDDMALLIRANTISRYKILMEDMLDNACQHYSDDTFSEINKVRRKDRETGEFYLGIL